MKYTGPNAEAFEREARLLMARPEEQRGGCWESFVIDLARRYGIGDAEIWDMLPGYEGVA